MPFAVLAEFPLGFYRGHVGDGAVDRYPSPARLHAAFLSAAGAGVRACFDEENELPMPSAEDLTALTWLESHPPDGSVVPQSFSVPRSYTRYRATGTLPKELGKWVLDKKIGDPPEATVALAGPLGWTWRNSPPTNVQHSLEALAADVPYLGTTESPVRLTCIEWSDDDVAPFDITHERVEDTDLWGPSGLDVDLPTSGRTWALIDAHIAYMSERPKKESKHRTQDVITPPPRVDRALSRARYVSVHSPSNTTAPWDRVLLVPLSRKIDSDWRVRWSVHFHRALIETIGAGAPPLITGNYGEAVERPANRMAIHILEPWMPSGHITDAPSTLALMIPRDADPSDTRILSDAVQQMRGFGGPGGSYARFVDKPQYENAAEFWSPFAEPQLQTVVPALTDIRATTRGWTMDRAVALSVGLLWRDSLIELGRGARWMRKLAERAIEHGVTVTSTTRIRKGDLSRFAHHVHPDALIAPYHAGVQIGELGTGRELVAIGQTRHLGGGLLVPRMEVA